MTHLESTYSTPWHHGLAPAAIDWCGVVMLSFAGVEVWRWWAGV